MVIKVCCWFFQEEKTECKASESKEVKLYGQLPPIEKMDASLSTLSCCEWVANSVHNSCLSIMPWPGILQVARNVLCVVKQPHSALWRQNIYNRAWTRQSNDWHPEHQSMQLEFIDMHHPHYRAWPSDPVSCLHSKRVHACVCDRIEFYLWIGAGALIWLSW